MAAVTGKTELAKQVARYMHKDIKKVHTHTNTHIYSHQCFDIQQILEPQVFLYILNTQRIKFDYTLNKKTKQNKTLSYCVIAGFYPYGHVGVPGKT